MPATSKSQQRFFGMVRAAQKGEKPASDKIAKAAKDISKSDVKDFASTPTKNLPDKVKNEGNDNQLTFTATDKRYNAKITLTQQELEKGIKHPDVILNKLNKAGFRLGSGHEEIEVVKTNDGGYRFFGTTFMGAPTQRIEFTKSKSKKEQAITKLREYIRKKIVKEMNVTGNVGGYSTPKAFGLKSNEKKKGERFAKLTGYTTVNEGVDIKNLKVGDREKNGFTEAHVKKVDGKKTLVISHNGNMGNSIKDSVNPNLKSMGLPTIEQLKKKFPKFKESGSPDYSYSIKFEITDTVKEIIELSNRIKTLNENRWLALKKEESPVKAKLGRGISNINKQLAEVERFLNWYGRLKQESGIHNEDFWKRTNHNIYKIKERLIKLEQQIRKFV